ncbi:MAG: alcohol dehydrogenase family protein [Alphaproteobacteria bacterium]|jgi:NADPH:quinone reductase-like Zn-dependent oxidoreductase|nr:alcohol dehydrogenase family protein [Alphaproteobacteria bacterium]
MDHLPPTMRAVVLIGHGGYDKLEYRDDVPLPRPQPGEALVRVGASAVNNTDINTRTSWYADSVSTGVTKEGGAGGFAAAAGQSAGWSGAPLSFPRIQGADICGEIVAVGAGVDKGRVGQRVLVDVWIRDPSDPLCIETAGCVGSECDGGFAEYATVPAECAVAISSDLGDEELASFPCAYITAENMVSRGRVAAGDTVLITGASGGVGSAAIQLCKRRGATVVATASESKHAELKALGADLLLPRQAGELSEKLAPLLPDGAVDAVLDTVGGPGFGGLIAVLRARGRYAACGAIAGPIVTFDARELIYRDLEFYGATLAPASVFEDLVGYIERGEIRPIISRVFPLSELKAAQEAFLSKEYVGKIVIKVRD